MRQRVLQWVAVTLFLLVGASFTVPSYSFKDNRWNGLGWFAASVACLTLAMIAAHQRPKSN